MSKVVRMKVEPLTPEAFEPFGEVIKTYEEARPEIRKGGLREKRITVTSGDRRRVQFTYHTDAGQAFYPSRHCPTVFMVGPVKEGPAPEDLRAFYSDGSLGICVRTGVWHALPICLEGEEIYQSIRGDQDYLAHTVELHFEAEQGLLFEPDL